MDAIKGKIEDTTRSLENKRSALLHHKQQYIDLKFKLLDFAQYDESDTPETDIKLNSKAIVKGKIINPNKILAFLGCEYFVERNPQEAVKVVENKLKFLNQAISEFDIKIKEAKKTLENIDELEKYEKENDEKKRRKSGLLEDVSDDASPLQFMDIREELDDDGNVISSTVKPQSEKGLDFGNKVKFEEQDIDDSLKESSDKLTAGPEVKTEEFNTELEELLRDMEIRPKQKIEEIVETSEDADTKENDDRNGADEFTNLMEEFGISESTAVTETKTSSEGVEKEDPASDTQNYGLLPIENFREYHPTRPAIEPEDIMQLQLISDEIDQDEEEYSDYEYDENDQEDDTAEEDTDWDFVTDGDALVPSSHRGLFVKELMKFRSRERNVPVDNQDKPVKERMRKSVSFAPNLEIKEVENISDELKKDTKLSKFRQRHTGVRSNKFETTEVVADIVERPVSDIIERDVSLQASNIQSSKIIPTNESPASEFEPYPQFVDDIDYESIKAYIANDEDEEEVLNQQIHLDIEGDDEDEDEGDDEDEDNNVLVDKIVENDQVEDPSYFVDENLLKREYQILRNKMINKYAPPTTKKSVLISKPPEGQEIEPIDQNGNPIKVSRFKASLKR